MTLHLPPPAGFNHTLLRYPVGRGFTQRAGYPFAGAPAQLWTAFPERAPGPAAVSAASSPACARVPFESQHDGGGGHQVLTDAADRRISMLPRIDEEQSTEGGAWGTYEVPCESGRSGSACASDAGMHDPQTPRTSAMGSDSGGAAPLSAEDHAHDAIGPAQPDTSMATAAGVDGDRLLEQSATSLAGPAPLEMSTPQERAGSGGLAARLAAVDAAQDAAGGTQASVPVVIRARGSHAPVVARLVTKPSLVYAAMEAGGEGATQRVRREARPAPVPPPDGAAVAGVAGETEIDMFSWINDRAEVRVEACGECVAGPPFGSEASAGQVVAEEPVHSGCDAAGLGGDEYGAVGAAAGATRPPVVGGVHTAAPAHATERLVVVPHIEPLLQAGPGDGWDEVAMRLAPVNRNNSSVRPCLSNGHDGGGRRQGGAKHACASTITGCPLAARMDRVHGSEWHSRHGRMAAAVALLAWAHCRMTRTLGCCMHGVRLRWCRMPAGGCAAGRSKLGSRFSVGHSG